MKKRSLTITLLILLLLLSATLSVLFGSVKLGFSEFWDIISGRSREGTAYLLITAVRIPRVLGCILAGIGLSSAGVILQSVLNNALASPGTIGVNSGSGFAVTVSLLLFPGRMDLLSLSAFLGALLTTLFVFLLANFADSSRTTIVLAGITISSFLNAGINTIKLLNTDITLNLTTFLVGNLSGLTLRQLSLPCILILSAFLFSVFLTRTLNILGMGDDIARSLGLPVNTVRFLLFVLSSIMAGGVVSFAGLLGFVGLITPHICRRLFGNDARFLLPCSALLGASFVLICDLLGRMIASPYELPAGIPLSFIGGPFFLSLLLRKKGGRRVNA